MRPADIGAAYFTARDPDFQQLVDRWCADGLARPWTDRLHTLTADGLTPGKPGPLRYATAGGCAALVRDLAAQLPPDAVTLASPVDAVSHGDAGPQVDGRAAEAVVLAMPDPQAARLLDPGSSLRRTLETRAWEPVLSLTAVFDARTWPFFDGAFVNGDPVLSFVADDGARRGDGAPVLVAHSTGPFAARYLDEPAAAAPELLAALDRLLATGPVQPGGDGAHVHRWSFARPEQERQEDFHWDADRIGVCGDSWGSPRVETAWLSGRALGRRIAADLGGRSE